MYVLLKKDNFLYSATWWSLLQAKSAIMDKSIKIKYLF